MSYLKSFAMRWNLGGSSKVSDTLSYNNSNTARDTEYERRSVGDLKIVGEIEVLTQPTDDSLFSVRIKDGSLKISLELGKKHKMLIVEGKDKSKKYTFDNDVSIKVGSVIKFELYNWDDRVKVKLNGAVALKTTSIAHLRHENEESNSHEDNTFYFVAVDMGLKLKKLKVWRDIYYRESRTGENTWTVPEGHFFALGDNVNNSHDSRAWKEFVPFNRLQGRPWLHLIHLDLDRPFSPHKDWDYGRVR